MVCGLCHNTDKIYFNDFNSEFICPKCKDILLSKWDEEINKCGVEYEHFNFSKFTTSKENQKQVGTCLSFAESKMPQACLILYSKNAGNGKTHLAIATLRKWLENNPVPSIGRYGTCLPPFKITTEPQLLLEVRNTFKSDSTEDESDIINKYALTKILVIDDVGKYNSSDLNFMQRVMFSIVDKRYTKHLPIIITSNKSGAELQDYLGAYTFDRLCGMAGNKITEIFGNSKRVSR